jgi:DNA helicase-2/ATP-dependent DNA helicase PcrA
MKNLLKELNPEQREAVLYFDSPLLILAGAGSGKTRVITYKIAFMVKHLSYQPERILAITFTNKAAKEMKERVGKLLGEDVPVLVSTFHSFCVRLIRAHAKKVGLNPNFFIVDEEDKRKILKEIAKELNLDPELYSPKAVSSIISNVKNGTISLESQEIYYDRIQPIYQLYNQRLKELNAVDFDDLLIFGMEILNDEKHKEYYSNYFSYVLIDEYQDTNEIQYKIARALTERKGNICAVGDEDQCIYTWRGANINNILMFEQDFRNAKVVKLERNYRSTKTILEAANAVISRNRLRKGKNLFTENPKGDPVRLFRAESESEEASFVAKTIKNLVEKKGVKPSDIAVFYRTNSLSRPFEDALRKEGIPYQIVGGVKFYERKEVKDVLAYLRLSVFKEDTLSLFRILNVPRRGLGAKVEELLRKITKESPSWEEALTKLEGELKLKKQKQAVKELRETLKILQEKAGELPSYDLVKLILKVTGYETYLRTEYRDDWENRLENVLELGNTIQEFAERNSLKGEELYLEFFTTVSLSSDQDELENAEKVTLMTVHASKGLEFPIVFVVGLEDDIFPHVKSSDTDEEIEEERRLFYVAMTRAKKLLVLSYSKKRRKFGILKETKPSRFLSEIPSHLIKEVERKVKPEIEKKLSSKPKLVFHPKFGKGVVKKIVGSGDTAKVTAFFANVGEKTIIMKFLKILA